ncbi:MAG TPA: Stp1/IreP family PP2C-type Ser/Thr phosphatase [Pyrinomonadaceae bacterium]
MNSKISSAAWEVCATIRTDPGCVREVNEDASRFISPNDAELLAKKGALLIVADGMGGHSAGEVASSLAVETISRAYFEHGGSPLENLRAAFTEANSRIYEAASADEKLEGMGTTCTALVLQNDTALAAHVGDSRLYLIRNADIYLMTEDHSAVNEMVKLGIISQQQARHHEDKNVILRALGTSPQVEITTWEKPLAVSLQDKFLLCSDGLTDLVEDEEIKSLVLLAADNFAACESLIDLAKKRGGYDNITVAILTVVSAGYGATKDLRETREAEVVL